MGSANHVKKSVKLERRQCFVKQRPELRLGLARSFQLKREGGDQAPCDDVIKRFNSELRKEVKQAWNGGVD